MCFCTHTVSVTCRWQVESTYVTIVVGIVAECVHAVWLFAVLSTTQQHKEDICVADDDCCDLCKCVK